MRALFFFYEFFVSRRRFLLRGLCPHVPNRPSVFRISLLLSLKAANHGPQFVPQASAIHAPTTMPQPPQKHKIMPSRASALRLHDFRSLGCLFLASTRCLAYLVYFPSECLFYPCYIFPLKSKNPQGSLSLRPIPLPPPPSRRYQPTVE